MNALASPSCTQRIQGNDARSMDFRIIDILLIPDLIGIANRFLPEAAQVDQIVTSQAAPLGS